MKTNRNFFSKLSKASLILALAFISFAPASSQNTASQPFHYKTDFIKQMVYQVSNDFLSSTLYSSASGKNKEAAVVLVNYTISDKNTGNVEKNSNDELTSFLIAAAQLNAPVAADVVVEKDKTLDFLTKAAQLDSEVATDNEQNNTLDLLLNAAQLNCSASIEEQSNESDLLNFLTQAAGLNNKVAE